MMAEYVAVGALAILLDLALGDPRNRYHPTAWAGRAIAVLAPLAKSASAARERLGGILVVLVPAGAAVVLLASFEHATGWLQAGTVGVVVIAASGALLLKSTIAIRGMERHATAVLERVECGDLEGARACLAGIVKRDTAHLDGEHVISGVLESVGENTVDGVTGPLFYYGLFGLPGAFAYRIVNTADSMVGYRGGMFGNLGWFAASADTVLNYVPARLTALLMAASAGVLGLDWRGSYRAMARYGNGTPSRNAGWPMAALAGALGTRLEKVGHYDLAGGDSVPAKRHVAGAVAVMKLTAVLFFGAVTVPLAACMGYLWGRVL